MSGTKEEEAAIVEDWMRRMTSPETWETLHKKQDELRQLQMDLLLEAAQMRVGRGGLTVQPARQKQLNVLLSVLEAYLVIVHCCMRKIEYFRVLLDPASYDFDVQKQLDYQIMLERIVDAEFLHVSKLFATCPDLSPAFIDFRRDAFPYKLLTAAVLQKQNFTN